MALQGNNPSLHQQKRVRVLWNEFEKWAQSQRKTLERTKADISYAQANKWKYTPQDKRNQAQHDEVTKARMEDAVKAHSDMLVQAWRTRLQEQGLTDNDWGSMTPAEEDKAAKVLLLQDHDSVPELAMQSMFNLPQSTLPYNPAPPLTSTARSVNLSTSTSSSYKFVDPSSFSTDDEGYDAEESFVASTDESGDEARPIHFLSKAPVAQATSSSSQGGSPDLLSSSFSSGSSADEFLNLPSSSSLGMNAEPPKRPPDIDRKGKAKVRGPAYIGPHLSSPDESSDEADFEAFKMQARIDKIYDFHLKAARRGAELAMAIQNDRMSKGPSFEAEIARRISEHEKDMLHLQAVTDRERRELVKAERKKRLEEISKRPVSSEQTYAPSMHLPSQLDWESRFKADHPQVAFNLENMLVFGPSSSLDEHRDSSLDSHVLVSKEDFGTVRAHKQAQSAAPSGWKTKHNPSPPTTAFSQVQAASTSTESSSWWNGPSNGGSLETSGDSFDTDAFSAHTSTPVVPPIPAGWGEKSSAAALLKKALSDPKQSSLPSNERYPTVEHSSGLTSTAKKPTKTLKGRQVPQKNGGPSRFDEPAESPTTPTVHTTSKAFNDAVSPKDILQSRYHPAQADDEMSSTPRPQGYMRRVVNGLDYASDVGGLTPKMGMASAFSSTSWTRNEQARQGNPSSRYPVLDEAAGWGHVNVPTERMEDMMLQDDSWKPMARRQGMESASQPQQTTRQDALNKGINVGKSRLPGTKPSPPGPELTLWEQRMSTHRPPPANTTSSKPDAREVGPEFWSNARTRLQAEMQQIAEPEETLWERSQRLKKEQTSNAQAHTQMHTSKPSWNGTDFSAPTVNQHQPSVPAQPTSKFWTPDAANSSPMWGHDAQTTTRQTTSMPGGYSFDPPQGYDHFSSASVGYTQGKIRMSSSHPRHPTVEEEPDEDGPNGRNAQRETLPYNSRQLLDIIEPKPSHPPTAFSDVIGFEDELEEHYDNGFSSAVPSPSTAPTSPPDDISLTEEWMKRATESLQNGTMDFSSFSADEPIAPTKMASMWSSALPAKQNAWGSSLDSTKLQSALHSVQPAISTTPPKAAPAPAPAAPASEPAPAPPTAPVSKAAPAPTVSAKAPAPEKPEPPTKIGNQNQNQNQKGKKGKGKGKK